jgi:HAMP domain-containing protein
MASKDVAIGSPEDLRGWADWVEGVRGTEPAELFDECSLAMHEAADEIEALRAEVERLRSSLAMRDEVLHRPRRRPPAP